MVTPLPPGTYRRPRAMAARGVVMEAGGERTRSHESLGAKLRPRCGSRRLDRSDCRPPSGHRLFRQESHPFTPS